MIRIGQLIPGFVLRFVLGDQTPPEQIREEVLAHLRANRVSSPYLIAVEIGRSVGVVELACEKLASDGVIRRSKDQIARAVGKGADGKPYVPAPYVRYELVAP